MRNQDFSCVSLYLQFKFAGSQKGMVLICRYNLY